MASLFRIPPPMDDTARLRCDAMMKQVENACSEMLLSPDWTLNMQIVDDLNRERDPVVLAEVIRILRKRLGSNNTRVLSVGLTLAETLVKNCHDPVHKEMASERFMTAVARIARTYSFKTNRESIAIADQALDIVQAWGEAFLPRRREFPLFVDTYHELRAEGLPFSEQYQSDRPPVLDPGAGSLLDRPSGAGDGQTAARPAAAARGTAESQIGGGRDAGGGATATGGAGATGGSDPNDLRELSVSDREIVATGASCSEMLEQVLQAAESRAEVRDSEITAEVVEQLKQVGPKISGIIEANGEGDAGMLEALFKVNDSVDSVLRLYKDVVDGVKSVPLLPPSSFSSNIGAISGRMEGLSVEQVAGAKAAASKLRKKVPTLSRPPSDRKHRRGGSTGSADQTKASGSVDTVDLLSGFELDGASNSNANKSVPAAPVQGDPTAAAAPGSADVFAAFAAPVPPSAATSSVPTAATVAGPGGDWVVVGGAQEAQGQDSPVVAAGAYGQPQGLNNNSQPPPAGSAGPPSTADKAQSLMANLGALYAGGSTTTAITPATGGNLNIGSGGVGSVGNGTAPVASGTPPTMSGFPELGGGVAGGPSTSWGGGGAAVETTAQGWAGGAAGGNSNNAMQAAAPSHVADPFGDSQQQPQLPLPPQQQGQQPLFQQGQQAPYQQMQQPSIPPQQQYQPQPVYEQQPQQQQQQPQYQQQPYPSSVPLQPQHHQQAQQQPPQAQQPFP